MSTGESRKVGEHERVLHYIHGIGMLVTLMVLHVRGPLDEQLMRRALDWLKRQHPMLRAHIRYGAPTFRNLPPFVYRQPWLDTAGTKPIPLTMTSGDWEAIAQKDLRRPLKRGKLPRVRVTVVRDGDVSHLLISADHAILDAQSCTLFARDLLEFLADPAAMEARPVTQHHLPPPIEAGLPKKSGSGKTFVPALRIPWPKRSTKMRGTRILSRKLTADETAAVRATARNKGATLHGAIMGAFFQGMRAKWGLDEMTCISSLDVRRMMKPQVSSDTYGCYWDVVRTKHAISPDLWTTARDVSFKLITTIARDHASASLLKLPPWLAYLQESWPIMTHRGRLDGIAMTTAGDSGLREHYGAFTLEDMTMGVSIDLVGPAMMVIASERRGGLDLAICYASDALSPADAEDLTARALGELTAAAPVLPAPATA